MNRPTLVSFLTECLKKSGVDAEMFELSDNSSSGISIRKEGNEGMYKIELRFDGNGLVLQDVSVFRVVVTQEDEIKVL